MAINEDEETESLSPSTTNEEDEEKVGFLSESKEGTNDHENDYYDDDSTLEGTGSKRGSKVASDLIRVAFGVACLVLAISFFPEETTLGSIFKHQNQNSKNGIRTPPVASFHQNSYGGLKNPSQPHGAIDALSDADLDFSDVTLPPPSLVSRAIPSLFPENVLNQWGHYVHDEHVSPFGSFLYDRPQSELELERREHVEKMKKVRDEWGYWSFRDVMKGQRPVADTHEYEYKDFPNRDLNEKVWQNDEGYVTDFLREAKALVERVTEGIYAEYGHPTVPSMTSSEIDARNSLFNVKITESGNKSLEGSAWMTERAMDGLVRKLLHAMITNDEFYVVLGGHSAAAGHGNNFHQDKIIQFHHLMEPVMDKLGVRLISRNLAMGGLGTLHFSLGEGTLYGEKDILIWDSGMTEKGPADKDLFNKQALLSGERVPLILHDYIGDLEEETGGTLLNGDMIEPIRNMVEKTTDEIQGASLPWAMQFLECDGTGLCGDKDYKYKATCWIDRKDVEPETKQNERPGSQVGWHPGDRHHRLQGRKVALMVLQALDTALDVWEQGIKKDGFPLKESYWHVGEMYKELQNNLDRNLKEKKEDGVCEEHFADFKRACRLPMMGMGEFTPRATDEASSIRNFIKPAPNGYFPKKQKSVYRGIDLLYPLAWKIPDGEVDVHAIAIATNYEAPDMDQVLAPKKDDDGDDKEEDNEEDNAKRLLRQRIEERKKIHADDGHSMKTENLPKDDRDLGDDNQIIPGQGWALQMGSAGFCDGSSMSTCNRPKDNQCLLYAANDNHGALAGDAFSGWLVVQIPKLENGLILAKMWWWSPYEHEHTKGWTEVNNGKTTDTRPYYNETTGDPIDYGDDVSRNLNARSVNDIDEDFSFLPNEEEIVNGQRTLKAPPPPLPSDMQFDIAINGKIIHTMDHTEYMKYAVEVAYNQAIFVLLDDESVVGDPGVELAVRFRSESDPRHLASSIVYFYYS